MKIFLAITALLFVFLGNIYGDPSKPLRVVAWNLQWFPGGKIGASKEVQTKHIETIRREIKRINPDILLLQEVGSEGALAEMLKPLGDEWKISIISRFNQGSFRSGQQLAIAAKFPAESAWAEEWQNGWANAPRGYAYATFIIKGKRLAVYCLHLKSNIGDPIENAAKREDSVEQLVDHMNSTEQRILLADSIIIGGDFNTDHPDTPAAQSPSEQSFPLLYKAGFRWGFEGVNHSQRITCPSKGRYPSACFDHIWTKNLGEIQSKVALAEGSDHLPVTIEISFVDEK